LGGENWASVCDRVREFIHLGNDRVVVEHHRTAPKIGATAQLTATATMGDGSTQDVTTLATWQSSNVAVATVSSTGVVTGIGTIRRRPGRLSDGVGIRLDCARAVRRLND